MQKKLHQFNGIIPFMQVYLVAGGQDGCEYCSYFSSTEIFSRGQWTIVGPLPEPLRGVRGVTVDNSVFMTGCNI